MKRTAAIIQRLLTSSHNREEILPYVERAKKYSSECGCAMGAKFLLASLGLFITYLVLSHDFGILHLLTQLPLGLLFIFLCTILGKLTGIALARIRLALLYRHLVAKYHLEGG